MSDSLSTPRRVVSIVVVLAAIAALAAFDRGGPSKPATTSTPRSALPGVVMPVAFPSGSLASTWFCAGGTASKDGIADHTVVLANPTDAAISANLTLYPGTVVGDPAADALAAVVPPQVPVSVPPRSVASVHLADYIDAPYAAALVEAPGGDLVVEHEITGAGGASAAPCATSGNPAWHFASGAVTQTTSEVLAVFNPFADNAVVDITFATSDGFRAPSDYQSLPIPSGHLVIVDVFNAVARHDVISASVVAKSGRLVVDRIQRYGSSPKGLSIALGAPEPASTWWFPDGQVSEGVTETYTVYNPSTRPASVDLEVVLDSAAQVDPIALDVAPRSYAQVAMNAESRVPPDIAHSVVVRSANGVPVVAERQIVSKSPATRTGVSDTLGSPLVATGWVFASGASNSDTAEFLVVRNPSSDTIARVHVVALAGGQEVPIEGLDDVEVPANARVLLDIGAHITSDQLALLVTSTQPVVIERSLYATSGPGVSMAIGVPLADGVSAEPG